MSKTNPIFDLEAPVCELMYKSIIAEEFIHGFLTRWKTGEKWTADANDVIEHLMVDLVGRATELRASYYEAFRNFKKGEAA